MIKNIMNKLLFIFLASFLLNSCDDRDLVELNTNATTEISLSETSIILTEAQADEDVLTVTWTEPNFGFDTAERYQILIDISGGDFSNPQTISVTDFQKTFTTSELNSKLLNLDVDSGTTSDFDFKVLVTLSDYSDIISETKTINITTYSSILDLSTTWGIVGSAANDWGNAGPDLPFYQTGENNVLVAYVTLIDGEIKFRENNDWTNNFGDTGADGTLEAGGDNIAVAAGNYKIVFNLNDLTYTINQYSWGIVGSAYNDWGATPDASFTYDPFSDQWRVIVTLLDGEFKIRQNNDWAVNYGDNNNDGVLDQIDPNNISITAGNYIITFNDANFSYSIEQIDNIWGLIGSAYNDWGATPDAIFTRDWSTPEDIWVLNNVVLLDGEFKIRANSAWDINYGDDDLDLSLDLNGTNIPATAGTYTIRLDFSDSENPTYTIN